MDQCFEAGLKKFWDDHYLDDYFLDDAKWTSLTCIAPRKEHIFLYFSDILPFFLILAVGFLIALLALVGEIFYRDFLSNLSKEYFKRKFGWRRKKKK